MADFSIDQLLSLSDDEEENTAQNQMRLHSLLNNEEDDDDSTPPTPQPMTSSTEAAIPHVTSLEWAEEDEEETSPHNTTSQSSAPDDARQISTESYSTVEQYQHTDCTASIPAGFIFMGLQKITITASQRAQHYILRPDIKAEAIMGLMEQVCISYGGAVMHPERNLSLLQITSLNTQQNQWSEIHIHLGANTRKQRVLLLILTPRSSLYTSLDTTFADLHHTVLNALHTEQFLISYLYSTSSSSLPSASSSATVDSIVDIHYVQDLQLAFAQELTRNIEAISHSLSSYITTTEKQCARLMTLLRPTFEMVGMEVPTPPTRKPEPPESHIANSSLCDGSLEYSKLLILRARRKYCDISSQVPPSASPDSELEFLLTYIFTQLRNLCETESKSIIAAKTTLAVERISAVENYERLLISTLQQRAKSIAVDEAIVSKFRLSEKSLISCKCFLYSENRYGTLYITSDHLLFDSYVVLLGTLQKVIPIYTITSVTHHPATLLLSDSISIKSNSTVLATLVLTSSSPQYTERVYQLLMLLLAQKQGKESSNISRVSCISIQAVQQAEEMAKSTSDDGGSPSKAISSQPSGALETCEPIASKSEALDDVPPKVVLPAPTPVVAPAALPPGKSPLANSIQV